MDNSYNQPNGPIQFDSFSQQPPTIKSFVQSTNSQINFESFPIKMEIDETANEEMSADTPSSSGKEQVQLHSIFNQQLSNPSQSMTIKEEILANTNETMQTENVQCSPTLFAQISKEHSNQNLTDYQNDDEKSDSDDCISGGIEQEDEADDSVQWIEDVQVGDKSFPPAKKSRLNTTHPKQPEVNQQPSRQPTVEAQPNQVNNQDRLYITVQLECTDCLDTFPENQLNQHMLEKHSIYPFRCAVKDCKESFNNKFILSDHIKQVHQSITQWLCNKCDHHFTAYRHLSNHKHKLHQLGHFQCAFSSCTFTGEYRMKVYTHYRKQHKPTLKCQHCPYQTPKANHLKRHERIHFGIKPYRCKWSQCDYASARQSDTIKHIRRMHLAANFRSVPNGVQLDPSDYVEVMHDLL